jgi:hypothetical protein
MIALTVGVEAGVGDGVGLTGHALAVGIGAKGSSDPASGAPLCANTAIGWISRPERNIKL